MPTRPILGAALAVVLAAAALAGCATPATPTIGIALPSDAGRWDDVAGVLRDRLEAAGYAVDVRVADNDIPTQVRQVEELLGEGPQALIVAPVDVTSLTTVLDRAPSQTEVVSLGTLVHDTGAVDRLVAFDHAVGGYLQATALLEGLGLVDATGAAVLGAGTFRIELFAGSVDDPRTEPAFSAAMSVLDPYLASGALVVGSGEAALDQVTTLRGNGATAASRLTRVLRDAYAPGSVPDAVLTPSDAIARGVAGVLIAAGAIPGEGFPVLTGRGAEPASVAALLDGRQQATLLEDPRLLAAEAAERVIEALRAPADPDASAPSTAPPAVEVDNGARRVAASLLSPQTVRADDIDALLVGSGYWTRAQLDDAIAEFGVEP